MQLHLHGHNIKLYLGTSVSHQTCCSFFIWIIQIWSQDLWEDEQAFKQVTLCFNPSNLSDFLVWKQMQNVEKKNKAEYYCDCQLLVCISLLYNVSDILWPIYPISK